MNHKLRFLIVNILVTMGLCHTISPSLAAKSIILKYGILREAISVNELSTFAKTGELSNSLRVYLDLANKKPEELRTTLNQGVKINATLLSKLLNSKPGELLLDGVSEIIQTPSQGASRESLRGALVTSALADNKITIVEIMENYPTAEVHVEGERLFDVYKQMKKVFRVVSRFGLAI